MATLEITDEGLREVLDSIEIPCERCGQPAAKVLRCRTYRSLATTFCTSCVAKLAAEVDLGIVLTGHVHCRGCGAAGESLAELIEILDL